jgi:hypothetical protein
MSTTPRTDEQVFDWTTEDGSDVVFASMARELETELVAMTARAEKAEAELAKAREKVRVLREALERRHTEQGYHRQYVDDALAATEEASK